MMDQNAKADFIDHLHKIEVVLGRLPTKTDLERLGEYKLLYRIRRAGGIGKVYEAVGLNTRRKRKNYWDSIITLIEELRPYCLQFGHIPSYKQLIDIGRKDLTHVIHKFGGIPRIREVMGLPQCLEAREWAKHAERIVYLQQELLPLFFELGHMPRRRELAQLGRYDLCTQIRGLGGFAKAAELLGFPPGDDRLYKAVDGHYVKSSYEAFFDNFLHINNIEHSTDGRVSVTGGRYYRYDFQITLENGESVVVEIWGLASRDESWYMRKRSEKEAYYAQHNKRFLSIEADVFRHKTAADSYNRLVNWCQINGVKSSGFVSYQNSLDIYTYSILDFESLRADLLPISSSLRRMPTYQELRTAGLAKLANEILVLGGVRRIAKYFNLPTKKRYDHLDLDGLKEEILPFSEHGRFPTKKRLIKAGRYDLVVTISRMGGFSKVAEALSMDNRIKPKGYWDDVKNLLKYYLDLKEKLGSTPSREDFRTVPKGPSMYRAICRHGGLRCIENLAIKTLRAGSK